MINLPALADKLTEKGLIDKASATAKNRYAQEVRYYTSADRFLDDFGDDEQAINCANHFKENCNGKDRTTGRRQVC